MTAIQDISDERERQLAKGWDAKHDDLHGNSELAIVAASVALHRTNHELDPLPYDWGITYKHDNDRRRQLLIAAALLVAEIERIDRLS